MSLRGEYDSAEVVKSDRRRWITPITVSLALVAATTAILWVIEAQLNQDHLIFVYFMPTALIAICYGSLSAMCVTIASGFAAAYFLYVPQFSLAIANPLDRLEVILFGLLALLASQVVSGFAKDNEVAKRRQRAKLPRPRLKWPAMAALWRRIRSPS